MYVQNSSPHHVLGNKTPKEMFSGEKPEVNHLRIFGCPVYAHVPKEKISKLESSGKKGIFVGYNESSKAYRVYISGFRQIETSRDVTFDEDVAFSRSKSNHIDEVHDEEPEAPKATATDAVDHGLKAMLQISSWQTYRQGPENIVSANLGNVSENISNI